MLQDQERGIKADPQLKGAGLQDRIEIVRVDVGQMLAATTDHGDRPLRPVRGWQIASVGRQEQTSRKQDKQQRTRGWTTVGRVSGGLLDACRRLGRVPGRRRFKPRQSFAWLCLSPTAQNSAQAVTDQPFDIPFFNFSLVDQTRVLVPGKRNRDVPPVTPGGLPACLCHDTSLARERSA